MQTDFRSDLETDDRFPSGEWVGFWLQRTVYPGRQAMELTLRFAQGKITGAGRDTLGEFGLSGRYDAGTGRVVLHKQYPNRELVVCEGWAEKGRGIWGVWSVPQVGKDGFHLWPRSMPDPTGHKG